MIAAVAPELLHQQKGNGEYGVTYWGRRRDSYAAGIILAELICETKYIFVCTHVDGRHAMMRERDRLAESFLQAATPLDAFAALFGLRKDLQFMAGLNSAFLGQAADLAAKLMTKDRFKRINPAEALAHPFFSAAALHSQQYRPSTRARTKALSLTAQV